MHSILSQDHDIYTITASALSIISQALQATGRETHGWSLKSRLPNGGPVELCLHHQSGQECSPVAPLEFARLCDNRNSCFGVVIGTHDEITNFKEDPPSLYEITDASMAADISSLPYIY